MALVNEATRFLLGRGICSQVIVYFFFNIGGQIFTISGAAPHQVTTSSVCIISLHNAFSLASQKLHRNTINLFLYSTLIMTYLRSINYVRRLITNFAHMPRRPAQCS